MLTREWMGVLALSILWVNTLLVAGAALQRVRALGRLARALATTVRRGVARGRVASVTVEQIGRYGAGATQSIVWHDRAYASRLHGGEVDVGDGEAIAVPETTRAMVWVSEAEMRAAAAPATDAAFDEAYPAARKAKGFVRKATADIGDQAEVHIARVAASDGDEETWLVATLDPVAWCRARARTILFGFVPAVIGVAGGITAVALVPPAFGVVSMIGAGLGVLYFLLVLPAGTAIRDWARYPHERIVRGIWKDPAGRPTPAAGDASARGKVVSAGVAVMLGLVASHARADVAPLDAPRSTARF